MDDFVLVLDFGSPYTQLIARRLRELNVYCEIYPFNKFPESGKVSAVILSGSPFSDIDKDALSFDLDKILNKYPILGISYGAQWIVNQLGGRVQKNEKSKPHSIEMKIIESNLLFEDVEDLSEVWMSANDQIDLLPSGFKTISRSDGLTAAFASLSNQYHYPIYGIQFHPEETMSIEGDKILRNFVFKIAGYQPQWTPSNIVKYKINEIKQIVGNNHVARASASIKSHHNVGGLPEKLKLKPLEP